MRRGPNEFLSGEEEVGGERGEEKRDRRTISSAGANPRANNRDWITNDRVGFYL